MCLKSADPAMEVPEHSLVNGALVYLLLVLRATEQDRDSLVMVYRNLVFLAINVK